jgi:hypothetical protein
VDGAVTDSRRLSATARSRILEIVGGGEVSGEATDIGRCGGHGFWTGGTRAGALFND